MRRRNMPRIALTTTLALTMTTAWIGCGPAQSRAENRPTVTIALYTSDPTNPVWPLCQAATAAFLDEYPSFACKTIHAATTAASDHDNNPTRHPLLTTTGYNALILWPGETDTPLVNALIERGVPVVLIGADLPESRRSAYVGWDQQQIGAMLVQLADQRMTDARTVIVLGDDHPAPDLALRRIGINLALAKFARLKLLASLDTKASTLTARQLVVDNTARYPQLGAWIMLDNWLFKPDGDSPGPAIPPTTAVFACHPTAAAWPTLAANPQSAFLAADYAHWGQQAARMAMLLARGNTLEVNTHLTDPEIVDAQNLDAWKARIAKWRSHVTRPGDMQH